MGDMRFWYPASITEITEINDSFDSCLLRVCYAGVNRNGSNISKAVIEKAMPTMAYCPLVANYDVETDTIGGHDVAFVEGDDGNVKMVNLTDAVGVIPEKPQWYWEERTEENGEAHLYLCTPAILWKRTPVYDKLKAEGVSGQSMEITVNEGRMVDGTFIVDDFTFTAFCLLGDDVEPCFESASVSMYSADVTQRFHTMLSELKSELAGVMTASADDKNLPNGGEEEMTKGGGVQLDINELMQKYGLTAEDITFEPEGMSLEELEAKFAEIHQAKFADDDEPADESGEPGSDTEPASDTEPGSDTEPASDTEPGDTESGDGDDDAGDGEDTEPESPEEDDNDDAPGGSKRFALTAEQMISGLYEALRGMTMRDEWGEFPRYSYVDHDPEACEVYVLDGQDWNLYGMKYSMSGDRVLVDFASAKRKKMAFVDYEMGEVQFDYRHMLDSAEARFNAVAGQVCELRQFKADAENAKRRDELNKLFAMFVDIADDERFAELRDNCDGLSIQDVEDKCYAIRGRKVEMVKFSRGDDKPIKLPVEHGANRNDEPYGGVFLQYGISK